MLQTLNEIFRGKNSVRLKANNDLAVVMGELNKIEVSSLRFDNSHREVRATPACNRLVRRLSTNLDLFPDAVESGDLFSWRGKGAIVEAISCRLTDNSEAGNLRIARKVNSRTAVSIDFTRLNGEIDDEHDDVYAVVYKKVDLPTKTEWFGWHQEGDMVDIEDQPAYRISVLSTGGNILSRIEADLGSARVGSLLIKPLDSYIRNNI